jgi:hypothetical protein
VLSEGLGGGLVLQVEHSGSGSPVGVVVVMAADGEDSVVVSTVSVQHGGGPTTGMGGRSSWSDVAMSVGSVAMLSLGRSRRAVGDAGSSGERSVDPVAIALSSRSKCLVMS